MVTLYVSLIMSSSLSINKDKLLVCLVIAEVVMSIITLLAYKIDKQKAKTGKWRTKEKTLLILPWLMGGLGGLFGVYGVRNKTNHWYFPLNNVLALIVQFALFASIYILM